jgi:flagellar basal body-associated protein FliL
MASAPATAPTTAPPKKKKGKLVLIVAAVVAAAAGGAIPVFVDVSKVVGAKPAEDGKDADKKKKKKGGHDEHLAAVLVGDVSVNLAEERMTRFIRVKVAVQVEAASEKKVQELVEKQKVALKSWMISHIAGKSLKDVSGTLGVNRLQREMMERFDDMLYPNGESPIRAVLFEEYIVQ